MAAGLGWILAANVAFAIDYSMIMPTGSEYIASLGGSEEFYGATIAAFPVGRLCLLLLVGHWSDKRGFWAPFSAANLLGVAGGLVYGLAAPLGSKWYAMLGRFLGGCGATHPLSAWAARSYPPEKRSQIEQLQKAASLIGVVLGPALNAFIVDLDTRVGFVQLNPRTCAGFIPAMVSLVLLVGFQRGVEEPSAIRLTATPPGSTTASRPPPCRRLLTTGAWVCAFIAFYTNLQISAMDTIIAPLLTRHLGFTLLQNSLIFAGLAVVSFLGAMLAMLGMRRGVKALQLMLVGSIVNLLGAVGLGAALWDAPGSVAMPLFFVSGAVSVLTILAYSGPNGGAYQQACGDAQGLLGGLFTMAFALGRPVGSCLGGVLLDGTPVPLCLLPAFCIVVGIAALRCVQGRLQQAEDAALAARASGSSSSAAGVARAEEAAPLEPGDDEGEIRPAPSCSFNRSFQEM